MDAKEFQYAHFTLLLAGASCPQDDTNKCPNNHCQDRSLQQQIRWLSQRKSPPPSLRSLSPPRTPVSLIGVQTKISPVSSMMTDEMTHASNIVVPLNGIQRDRGILLGSLQSNSITNQPPWQPNQSFYQSPPPMPRTLLLWPAPVHIQSPIPCLHPWPPPGLQFPWLQNQQNFLWLLLTDFVKLFKGEIFWTSLGHCSCRSCFHLHAKYLWIKPRNMYSNKIFHQRQHQK